MNENDATTAPVVSTQDRILIRAELSALLSNYVGTLENLKLTTDPACIDNVRYLTAVNKLKLIAAYLFYFGNTGKDLIIEILRIIEAKQTMLPDGPNPEYTDLMEAKNLLMEFPVRGYNSEDYLKYESISMMIMAATTLVVPLITVSGSFRDFVAIKKNRGPKA